MAENTTPIKLGTRTREAVRPPQFPDAGPAVREHLVLRERPSTAVDVLLVNPTREYPVRAWFPDRAGQLLREHSRNAPPMNCAILRAVSAIHFMAIWRSTT
jgi:hypothetical protein